MDNITENYIKNKTRKGIFNNCVNFLYENYSVDKNKNKLLDVGIGHGIITNYAHLIGYEVEGIDYDLKDIDLIYTYIKVKECDINKQKLPYKNNNFNIIIFTEVIEHLYNVGFTLSELNRVLAKEGKLFLTTPNLLSLKNKLHFLFTNYFLTHKKPKKVGDHITHLPTMFIVEFLKLNGFKNIKIKYINSYLPFTKIDFLNNNLFSETIMITAEKI